MVYFYPFFLGFIVFVRILGGVIFCDVAIVPAYPIKKITAGGLFIFFARRRFCGAATLRGTSAFCGAAAIGCAVARRCAAARYFVCA